MDAILLDRSDAKLLLTVAEATVILGLSRSHIYRLILTGELRSITIGRSRRIPISVLQEFIEERLGGAADE